MARKYIIADKKLNEFIGLDYEIANSGEIQNPNKTTTNPFDSENIEDAPQTTDDFGREANVPWYGRYIGYGGSVNLNENDDNQPSETIQDINAIDDIYGESVLMTKAKNFVSDLVNLRASLGEDNGIDIQLIITKYMLKNIDWKKVSKAKKIDLLK